MKTEIWGHRGASFAVPENTLPAFERAWKEGADGVELDVQMTRDGKIVVIHDETVDRVSDCSGWVKDLSWQELRKMDVKNPHPEFGTVTVPLLEEVYDLLKATDLKINVELKTGICFYPGLVDRVLQLSKEWGMEERIWYSSFNHYTLLEIRQKKPDARIGMLYADGIFQPQVYAKQLNVDALHPALYNLQFPGVIQKAKEENLPIHVWTVDEKEHLEWMFREQVEAVITNRPGFAREVLDSL